ncbi:MAG: SDR family NAD(P)-dependent oxidoreductase [bacterium]
MDTFTQKNVLITGASSGIGKEFAKQLAGQGATLILTARSEAALKELAHSLSEQHKVQTHVFCQDLGQPGGAQLLAQKIQQAGLQVDVVINNAGFGKWGPFESVDAATYEAMLNLNIHAVVALTHFFLPAMLERGEGGFINVASTAGFQPVPYFSTYSASKAFVISFSEGLWREYKDRGVVFTCLCPGGTDTNFHEVSQMDKRKLIALASSEKVAQLALQAFLKGKLNVIAGAKNYLLANSIRFAPRRWVTEVTAAMFRP